MATFYTVSTGATVAASDINQFSNDLNGTTQGYIIVVNAASSNIPIQAQLASAPGADSGVLSGAVSGDTVNRLIGYIRGADGYGGLKAGAGSSVTATMYAQSSGWKIDQSLTVATNLSVAGTSALDNGAMTTSGSGGLTLAGITASGAISANQLRGNFASGSYYDGSSAFSGTGSGTYTHGLNHAPTFVGVIQNVSNSTTTVGVDSIGSTTCHVNVNGSFAFLAWAVLN